MNMDMDRDMREPERARDLLLGHLASGDARKLAQQAELLGNDKLAQELRTWADQLEDDYEAWLDEPVTTKSELKAALLSAVAPHITPGEGGGPQLAEALRAELLKQALGLAKPE